MRSWIAAMCGLLILGAAGAASAADDGTASLPDALTVLKAHRFVDLTHAFAPGIPHWKGAPNERVKTLYTVAKDGFRINEYCHIGQWGTHLDAPAHFHEGLLTADRIDPKDMLMPLVVIDVHSKVAKNPDYVLTVDDITAWEKRHGTIPRGAFVAMRTDWSKRWPDDAALANKDAAGVFHYPGWTKAALELLYEKRGITASGHETTDTDPGLATTKDDYSLESYILGLNHYQVELLANLDQVPEAGGLVWVTTPKVEDGAGFPARVIAIVPMSAPTLGLAPIEYAAASPEVRAVYDDIMATRQVDWVNNYWKVLANHPPTLRRMWANTKEVMGPGALDPLTKELIYLAVSMTNGCRYCIASHGAAARKKGMTPEQHAELIAIIGLANETNRHAFGLDLQIDEQFR